MTEIRGNVLGEMARAWQNGQIDPEEYFEWAWERERKEAVLEVRERLAAAEAQRRAEAREVLKGVVRHVVGVFSKTV